MRYVSIAEMREIDRRTIEGGVPAATLMENAGRAVAAEVLALRRNGAVLVLAGYGNNGGDGLVVARLLLEKGVPARTFLVGEPRPFSPETGFHHRALAAAGGEAAAIGSRDFRSHAIDDLLVSGPASVHGRIGRRGEAARRPGPGSGECPDVVVDAVFGVGMRGAPGPFHAALFEAVNRLGRAGARVVAVDVPSGLDADSGRPAGACVRADCTVTMGFPKAGFKAPGAGRYLGRLVVADIGLTAA